MSSTPAAKPTTSAIVIAYNSRQDLETNLPGLVSIPDCQVIVVDNASSDGAAAYVNEAFPSVDVVASAANLGFGGGANIGADHATGEVLLFLNPDISIDAGSLEALAAEVAATGGVAGPVIVDEGSGESQYGFRLDWMGMTVESLTPIPPLFVQGCALAIDAGLFRRIDGFDTRYFLFSEDAELCWRAAGTGASITIVATARACHGGGHSIPGGYVAHGRRQIANTRFALRERNTLAMFLSNAPLPFLVVFTPIYLAKLALFATFACATDRRALARSLADGVSWNVRHLPITAARRRTRPGRTTWTWLCHRLTIYPAILTQIRRHGLPTFIAAGSLPA